MSIKIKSWSSPRASIRFALNEYTTQYGAIIFDGSKGGTISDTVRFRLNKELSSRMDNDNAVSLQSGAFIDLYIDSQTERFRLIEFVALEGFQREKCRDRITISLDGPYEEPVVDTSVWVSPYGNIPDPYGRNLRYLNTADQVDLRIVYDDFGNIRLVFGLESRVYSLSKTVGMGVDEDSNLASLVVLQAGELCQLI